MVNIEWLNSTKTRKDCHVLTFQSSISLELNILDLAMTFNVLQVKVLAFSLEFLLPSVDSSTETRNHLVLTCDYVLWLGLLHLWCCPHNLTENVCMGEGTLILPQWISPSRNIPTWNKNATGLSLWRAHCLYAKKWVCFPSGNDSFLQWQFRNVRTSKFSFPSSKSWIMFLYLIFFKLQFIFTLFAYYAFLFLFLSKEEFSKFSLMSMKPNEPNILNLILSFNFVTKIKIILALKCWIPKLPLSNTVLTCIRKTSFTGNFPQPILIHLLLLLCNFIPLRWKCKYLSNDEIHTKGKCHTVLGTRRYKKKGPSYSENSWLYTGLSAVWISTLESTLPMSGWTLFLSIFSLPFVTQWENHLGTTCLLDYFLFVLNSACFECPSSDAFTGKTLLWLFLNQFPEMIQQQFSWVMN